MASVHPSSKHSCPLTGKEGEGHGEGLEEALWEMERVLARKLVGFLSSMGGLWGSMKGRSSSWEEQPGVEAMRAACTATSITKLQGFSDC